MSNEVIVGGFYNMAFAVFHLFFLILFCITPVGKVCGNSLEKSTPAGLAQDVIGGATVNMARRPNPQQDSFFINSIGMKFKLIPAGSFLMGSPANEKGRNSDEGVHLVEIENPFYLGIYEVTQAQWRAVRENNPSCFRGDDRPVEQVSWTEVNIFIRKLNAREVTDKYRLPTEAEWEYACRSGTEGPFSFGNCLSTDQANYNGNYPYPGCLKGVYWRKTLPVGSLRANAWGLYDMHGNVGEWCQDWHGKYYYFYGPSHDPHGPTIGLHRVNRGGGWYFNAYLCRSANRDVYSPDYGCDAIGFRLLRMP